MCARQFEQTIILMCGQFCWDGRIMSSIGSNSLALIVRRSIFRRLQCDFEFRFFSPFSQSLLLPLSFSLVLSRSMYILIRIVVTVVDIIIDGDGVDGKR